MSHELTVDDYVREPVEADSPIVSVRYRVTSDAQPDILVRIAGALMFANQTPTSVNLEIYSEDGVLTHIVFTSIRAVLADRLRRKLAQLTCVSSVEMCPWP